MFAVLLYMFVCAGMGFNMVTLTSYVIVQQHFEKFRALAAAIAACGISVGSLSSGPLLTAMLNAFQWRGTLLLMAAMVLNCCVFGALYRPPPTKSPHGGRRHQTSSSSDGVRDKNLAGDLTLRDTLGQVARDLTNLSLFSNVPFTLVCIGTLMMNLGIMVFIYHTPSRAMFLGIERRLAYLLPSVAGLALLFGRIIGGIVGNLSCTNRLLQYGISIVIGGFLLILLGSLESFTNLAVFGAASGFVAGMLIRLLTVNYIE